MNQCKSAPISTSIQHPHSDWSFRFYSSNTDDSFGLDSNLCDKRTLSDIYSTCSMSLLVACMLFNEFFGRIFCLTVIFKLGIILI